VRDRKDLLAAAGIVDRSRESARDPRHRRVPITSEE